MTAISTPASPPPGPTPHPLLAELGVDADPATGRTRRSHRPPASRPGRRRGRAPAGSPPGAARATPRTWTCRQVAHAVAPRIAATKNSTSSWHQVTIGAVPQIRSATGCSSQPPTRCAQARSTRRGGPQPRRPDGLTGGSLGHWTSSARSSRRVMPPVVRLLEQVGDRPGSGSTASGSTSYHGCSTNARSSAARVRELEESSSAAPVAHDDQVDVEGARRVAPRCARARRRPRWPAPGPSAGWRSVVSISTTALRNLPDPSGRRPARSRRPGETAVTQTSGVSASESTAPWRLAIRSPRLDPSASTARRIGRISPVRVSASMMYGLGVSVTSALTFPGDRQRDVRERRVDGGIRLVDGHLGPFNTVSKRQTSAIRWARVSIRSTGSVSTAAFTDATRLP